MAFFRTPDLRRLSTRVSVCCVEIAYELLKHGYSGENQKECADGFGKARESIEENVLPTTA
jgi:hypothetical protein